MPITVNIQQGKNEARQSRCIELPLGNEAVGINV